MVKYGFWCENCQLYYVVERPMEDSTEDSLCVICDEKSIRKYNVSTVFKGEGFYSNDKKTKKGK